MEIKTERGKEIVILVKRIKKIKLKQKSKKKNKKPKKKRAIRFLVNIQIIRMFSS